MSEKNPPALKTPAAEGEKLRLLSKNGAPLTIDKNHNTRLNGKIINKPHAVKINLPRDCDAAPAEGCETKTT